MTSKQQHPLERLKEARLRHERLLKIFGDFHKEVTNAKDTEFCVWSVSELASDSHSFSIDFLDAKVLCVFSMRRWADTQGVLSFYRLSRVDPDYRALLIEKDFATPDGKTGDLHFHADHSDEKITIGYSLGARELIANVLLAALETKPA